MEKPIRNPNEEEDESDVESFSIGRGHFRGGRHPTDGSQPPDSSRIVFKKCTVTIKRVKFIERAIRMGFSSLTRVSRVNKNGKKGG